MNVGPPPIDQMSRIHEKNFASQFFQLKHFFSVTPLVPSPTHFYISSHFGHLPFGSSCPLWDPLMVFTHNDDDDDHRRWGRTRLTYDKLASNLKRQSEGQERP